MSNHVCFSHRHKKWDKGPDPERERERNFLRRTWNEKCTCHDKVLYLRLLFSFRVNRSKTRTKPKTKRTVMWWSWWGRYLLKNREQVVGIILWLPRASSSVESYNDRSFSNSELSTATEVCLRSFFGKSCLVTFELLLYFISPDISLCIKLLEFRTTRVVAIMRDWMEQHS